MEMVINIDEDYEKYLNSREDNIKTVKWRIRREIPYLPASLKYLYCNCNNLTTLPHLPNSLKYLGCVGNQLTSLTSLDSRGAFLPLPDGLKLLYCQYNHLTSLPHHLPDSLTHLCYDDNHFLYFPYDIPKFNIEKNVNKIPTLRKVVKKFRDKVRIKMEKELLFLPLPIPLIKMICEY